MKKGLFYVLVCMLMIVSVVIPVTATPVSKTISYPISMGTILYVGGSGPNNYTRIQDAINDSSDGDTVFVYDDSSPYQENLVVDKSISLIGENKYTTIIDGANISNGVNITADDVTVTGFTIQNCCNNRTFISFTSGILLCSNHNRIMDNILVENDNGISNIINYSLPRTGHNTIINNQIMHNDQGIYFVNTSNDTISGNIISQSEQGIMVLGAANTNISFNVISENEGGIFIIQSYNTVIYRNNISYNNGGVAVVCTSDDKVLQNNFIGNKKSSAISSQLFLWKIMFIKLYLQVPIGRNVWDENYWDEPRSFPYVIFGVFKLRFCIDWHPAQEPYDISEMS